MQNKYKNKYRTTSIRLPNWNYQNAGLYFVTICISNKKCFFGDIIDNNLLPSILGNIATKCWINIPHHHQDVDLHDYVIMPNHIHGIIEIKTKEELQVTDRLRNQGKNSLSSIIGSYKSAVSRRCKKYDPTFSWQEGFYEHIIRSEKALYYIQNYIQNNVRNWKLDELHQMNIETRHALSLQQNKKPKGKTNL